MILVEFYLLVVILALIGIIVWILRTFLAAHTAWDIERGRYVAALLVQNRSGDLAASSVVRARPVTGPVKTEEPKPTIYQEGM